MIVSSDGSARCVQKAKKTLDFINIPNYPSCLPVTESPPLSHAPFDFNSTRSLLRQVHGTSSSMPSPKRSSLLPDPPSSPLLPRLCLCRNPRYSAGACACSYVVLPSMSKTRKVLDGRIDASHHTFLEEILLESWSMMMIERATVGEQQSIVKTKRY